MGRSFGRGWPSPPLAGAAPERQGNRRQDLEIILRQAETFITQSKGFY
jgi:hypothetical protein